MKAIYLSTALLFFTVSAIGQTDFLKRTVSPHLKNNFLTWQNKQPIKPTYSFPQYGIVKLQQDNMPCFVPDVASIAAMPTIKTVSPYRFIPNPYFTYNNSP